MKRAKSRLLRKGAIELIEEAIHLLRSAPAGTQANYYLGPEACVLGLLYFWRDTSRTALTGEAEVGRALGVALLFLWMKFWQAIFAGNLRDLMAGKSPTWPTFSRCRRLFIAQTALQPTGLFLLPLSLIPALPFAWLYAFYQSVTAVGEDESGRVRPVFQRARKQTVLWPGQNHLALAMLSGFGLFVLLNWIAVSLLLPGLVKTLFGVETMFSRSVFGMLNTTFFMAMFGLTYLCVDPIVKAFYALRCFYGESLRSGEDLKVELRQFALSPGRIAACLLAAVLLCGSGSQARSAEVQESGGTSPSELDQAIQKTIQQRKYTWRMPREKSAEAEGAETGVIGRFVERAVKMLKEWLKAALDWLDEFLKKLLRNQKPGAREPSGYGWIMSLQILVCVLVAAVA